jgi:hypothetical protein
MNNLLLKFLLTPIVIVSVAGCQQSSSGGQLDPSPVLPSADATAKDDRVKSSRILSGQLVYDRAADIYSIDLKGTQGLRVDVEVIDDLAFFGPRSDCTPCNPGGGRVRVAATLVDSSVAGRIDLRGKTYVLGTGPSDPVAALEFSGEGVVLPPPTPEPVQLTAPFQFTGRVAVPQADGSTDIHFMTGQGVATLNFETLDFAPELWQTTRAVYEFQR